MKVQLFTRINSSENTYFFEPILYYTHRHLTTGKYDIVYSYLLRVPSRPNTYGIIHFSADHTGHRHSLPGAPFGGIQQSGSLTEENLSFLLNCILEDGYSNDCRRITISSPPVFYDDPHYTSATIAAYNSKSFVASRVDRYHAISVVDQPLDTQLGSAALRRLNKCRRAGMVAGQMEKVELEFLYRLMRDWRKACGYDLSLSGSEFRELMTLCPDDIIVFQATLDQAIVAVSVVIKVNSSVLYNFLPCWDFSYRTYSPTVLLTNAIYDYGRKNGFRWLDLGRSLDQNGKEKAGLINFKERIGGKEFPRTVWTLDL